MYLYLSLLIVGEQLNIIYISTRDEQIEIEKYVFHGRIR